MADGNRRMYDSWIVVFSCRSIALCSEYSIRGCAHQTVPFSTREQIASVS